jgi:hypothetical protein
LLRWPEDDISAAVASALLFTFSAVARALLFTFALLEKQGGVTTWTINSINSGGDVTRFTSLIFRIFGKSS